MRSKISFILLFMLSFIIVHDTFINVLEKETKVVASHDICYDSIQENCTDVHEIHSMFHFVGVISNIENTLPFRLKEHTPSSELLGYALAHTYGTIKPPIV